MLMPLMRGTEGKQKMSKSLGNAIGIFDDPDDMYGKVMSIPDDMNKEYITYGSGAGKKEIPALIKLSESDPYELKHHIAGRIVSRYHEGVDPELLKKSFLARFKHRELPTPKELIEDGLTVQIENDMKFLPLIMVATGSVKSNGEAKRLIKGGGVSIDGTKMAVDALDIDCDTPFVLKIGKRRFFLIYHNEEQLSRL